MSVVCSRGRRDSQSRPLFEMRRDESLVSVSSQAFPESQSRSRVSKICTSLGLDLVSVSFFHCTLVVVLIWCHFIWKNVFPNPFLVKKMVPCSGFFCIFTQVWKSQYQSRSRPSSLSLDLGLELLTFLGLDLSLESRPDMGKVSISVSVSKMLVSTAADGNQVTTNQVKADFW